MNMKKSIAGVMAGAMAVSAMAAAVSADQDAISLTYDLKTYVENNTKTAAKVTVVANYASSFVSDDSIKSGKITFGADNSFLTGGVVWEYGAFQNVKAVLAKTVVDASGYTKFVDKNDGSAFAIGEKDSAGREWYDRLVKQGVGSMTEFEFSARGYDDLVTKKNNPIRTYKATGNAKAYDGSVYNSALDDGSNSKKNVTFDMPITTTETNSNAFSLMGYDLFTIGYSVDKNAEAAGIATVKGTKYAVKDAVAKMTYVIPNVVSVNAASGWGWNININNGSAQGVAINYFNSDLTKNVDMSAELFTLGFNDEYWGKKTMVSSNTALENAPSQFAIGAFTAGEKEEKVYPFKTTLKPSLTSDVGYTQSGYVKNTKNSENDVVAALQSRKAGNNYYTKPVAVINDAIANHTNVTFTFTSYAGYVGTAKSNLMNQWVEMDRGYDYETSGKGFDWHNPTFGQHLYTNVKDSYSLFDSDDYDMYGSYSSAWGINLFTGAVVVNNAITMQLSDVDTFNWGSNTLTFDWFDITDDGKITDAKTFLKSMLLYTPVDWYWDTLTVVVTDEEREDIDAGAGLEDEPEVIEDEPEIVEDPEVVDPEVDETEAVTEAAPVETAPSPATGNAPVALAVIPVALAAAAVVAKKRG